jgi:hypothetical protein
MVAIRQIVALTGVLALGACVAPPPSGPDVMAMPGDGKSFDQFRSDDASCRQYAQQQAGPVSPSQAATNSAVGSAAVGTVLGAAAGAAIGAATGNPAAGAAIGAGSGLVLGSAAGANNAQASGGAIQQQYDMAYLQCMSAKGEKVPTEQNVASAPPPSYAPGYYAPGYYGPYPYPGYYYGPAYYGPGVVVGWGPYYRWRHW